MAAYDEKFQSEIDSIYLELKELTDRILASGGNLDYGLDDALQGLWECSEVSRWA